jgi:hypothetical protein
MGRRKGAGDRALLGDVLESAGKNRHGNFDLECFCPLRRSGGVRQLPEEGELG